MQPRIELFSRLSASSCGSKHKHVLLVVACLVGFTSLSLNSDHCNLHVRFVIAER